MRFWAYYRRKSRKTWGGGEGVIDHHPYEETAMCSLSVSVFGGWLMVRRAGAIRRIPPPRPSSSSIKHNNEFPKAVGHQYQYTFFFLFTVILHSPIISELRPRSFASRAGTVVILSRRKASSFVFFFWSTGCGPAKV